MCDNGGLWFELLIFFGHCKLQVLFENRQIELSQRWSYGMDKKQTLLECLFPVFRTGGEIDNGYTLPGLLGHGTW